MWMLSFLPDSFLIWVISILLMAGVVGFVSSFFTDFIGAFIPPIRAIKFPLRYISVLLLVVGVYFYGSYDNEMQWRKRVADLEAKVAVAEAKSKDANIQIQTKIVEKIKVVKEQQVVIQEKIKVVENKIDSQCKVAPEVIDILNEAATLGVQK